jgi:hypothetical protein
MLVHIETSIDLNQLERKAIQWLLTRHLPVLWLHSQFPKRVAASLAATSSRTRCGGLCGKMQVEPRKRPRFAREQVTDADWLTRSSSAEGQSEKLDP